MKKEDIEALMGEGLEKGRVITVFGKGRDVGSETVSLHELTKNMSEEEKHELKKYLNGGSETTFSMDSVIGNELDSYSEKDIESLSQLYPSMIEEKKNNVPIRMSRTERRKLQRKRAKELKKGNLE
jgi:hypothetical protein